MDAREIFLFAQIEKDHFFYRARREIVRYWLSRFFSDSRSRLVIDVGAGTGLLLNELSDRYEAIGCDVYFDPEVSLAKTRLIRADACQMPFPDELADATVALDLLEHLQDDLSGLRELKRVTSPGGYLFINVPAFSWLWSDWDQAEGHQRRYHKKMIKTLAEKAGLEIVLIRYVNSVPFLPIFLYRLLRSRLRIGKKKRWEDSLPPRWLNRFLLWAFIYQGRARWLNLPFGVSLFAILRKPNRNRSPALKL